MSIQAQEIASPVVSREIDGKGRTVRELLANRKYSIDYYQREYKWQHKQVAELIEDLTAKFLDNYEDGDERSAVGEYRTQLFKAKSFRQKSAEVELVRARTTLSEYRHTANESPRSLARWNRLKSRSFLKTAYHHS
jgi:hypothetical protein